MATDTGFCLSPRIPTGGRPAAAALFWSAFSNKLGPVMRPEGKALAFLEGAIDPEYGHCALDRQGRVIGLAGFKTDTGALINGGWRDLRRVYGTLGAAWRAPLLALLERDVQPGVLLMDGIAVAPEARGLGIGTALLDAIAQRAGSMGLGQVRLDVIDSNPRARALYERQRFRAIGTENIGPLRHLFGFRTATRMIRDLNADD